MSSKTADLGTQIAQQRDRLTDTVSAFADKIDTHEIADTLKERAASSAGEFRETAADEKGRKGLILGAIAALVGLIVLRRLLR